MDVRAYLSRIGHTGPVAPDLATLSALMAGHVHAIAFENLDIYLERPVSPGLEQAFDKLVRRRRGGWCYEMNGVFEWVLHEIGFDVRRLSAGVRRSQRGDAALGNHLALMVRLDQDYLVDVGFGSGQVRPMPMAEGSSRHAPIDMALSRLEDGFWRLHEGGIGAAHSYDFKPDLCDEDLLAARFEDQVSDPASTFRTNLVVMKRRGDELLQLRGRMLTVLGPGRKQTRLIASADELAETLARDFGLIEPDCERAWPMLCARHDQLFWHAREGRKAER